MNNNNNANAAPLATASVAGFPPAVPLRRHGDGVSMNPGVRTGFNASGMVTSPTRELLTSRFKDRKETKLIDRMQWIDLNNVSSDSQGWRQEDAQLMAMMTNKTN